MEGHFEALVVPIFMSYGPITVVVFNMSSCNSRQIYSHFLNGNQPGTQEVDVVCIKTTWDCSLDGYTI